MGKFGGLLKRIKNFIKGPLPFNPETDPGRYDKKYDPYHGLPEQLRPKPMSVPEALRQKYNAEAMFSM